MIDYTDYIIRLVKQGGPKALDYTDLDHWVADVHAAINAGLVGEEMVARIKAAFGDALSPNTMQGFALAKPHGYAGDFEMIDRIYQIYVCSRPHLANWDRFYQQHAAPKAVRNRKKYFHRLLDKHTSRKQPLRVLKIAVGPGRSMFEWLSANPNADVTFDCVEIDSAAIRYASQLNEPFLGRINFIQKNALRFNPVGQYDLIWAAGLFDYFDDRIFVSLLQRFRAAIALGGEIVIGNFSDRNPSRAYMELVGEWKLHHRSAEHLVELAVKSGALVERTRVNVEPEQVNFFLHVAG